VALNVFFLGSSSNQKRGIAMILDVSRHHRNPLDFVPLETLIAWCDVKPMERYSLMAGVVTLYATDEEKPRLDWNAGALAILEKSPDRIAVLKQFVCRFRPRSWSGSRAAAMEARLPLLRTLEKHSDPAIAQFAKTDGARLKKEADEERKWETRDDRASDERFE
jgi:hypothetical protein